MKFDPPLLTRGPLSGNVYVVTHGKVEPHPTQGGETIVVASIKYDVSNQVRALRDADNTNGYLEVLAEVQEMLGIPKWSLEPEALEATLSEKLGWA